MYTQFDGQSRQIRTQQGMAVHRVHHIGPVPIIRHFLERMSFSRIVSSCLGTGREFVDHAHTLSVLIVNILLSPSPLYRIAEWTAPFSAAALGLTPSEKNSINDDRVARSLDALVSPQARRLFFRLALHTIKQFELDTRRIHHDTTTVTFFGQYKGSLAEPRLTHGHNKDHRPDLKQLVFGLSVTADGAVPLSHEIYSGNPTDDTVHCGNVDNLRHLLGKDDFIYVADSKLATQKNLAHIASYGGKFVSVLPRTRTEDQLFRKQLRAGQRVRWRRFLVLNNQRRHSDPPDIYQTTNGGPKQTNEGYRLLWCRSSQKADHDAEARENRIAKAEADLFDLTSRINRRSLRSRSSILDRAKAILRRWECQRFITIQLQRQVHIQTHRLRRGRPRKDGKDPVRQVRTHLFHLHYTRDTDVLRAESNTDGVFPIVSNITQRAAPKAELVRIYKYQPYVEKRHALLKSEPEIAPVIGDN
jgi:transposase